VVLILIAVAGKEVSGLSEWTNLLTKLLLLGPVIGLVVGGLGSWLMAKVDAMTRVRREYQALYGVGLVLAAYAGATAVDGDGFLAAFAAGLGVVLLNQTLCDCFLEFARRFPRWRCCCRSCSLGS
jgi:NhaP-type Na+/H+ or K+/H+ antiporter